MVHLVNLCMIGTNSRLRARGCCRHTYGVMISDNRIEEFRRVYKESFGEEPSVAETREMANRLVALYTLLMRPLPDWREAVTGDSAAQTAPEES
jgi:hypothetical protein